MIIVLDPGIGNLSSVQSGFARVGGETRVVQNGQAWEDVVNSGEPISGVVLPGVGAFGDAMFQLRASGLLPIVRRVAKDGIPLFGICLGMQLLFAMSEEHGSHMGLGFLPGKVVRFTGPHKIPHMGWNDLTEVKPHPVLDNVKKGDYVYFVHSFYAEVQESEHLLASAEYAGVVVPAVVGRDHIVGAQFHPEKSGPVGEKILANFVTMCKAYDATRGVIHHG